MLSHNHSFVNKRLSICVLLLMFHPCIAFARVGTEQALPINQQDNPDAQNMLSQFNAQKTPLRQTLKDGFNQLLSPQSSEEYKTIKLNQLSKYDYDPTQTDSLPTIGYQPNRQQSRSTNDQAVGTQYAFESLDFYSAIQRAVSRHPQISQSISNLAAQNSNIDVAKANYYPQISGGISTGDMSHGEGGRQLISINATQMLYDFGKTKSLVSEQQAKLLVNQANVLINIDDIASQVADTIVNINRYRTLSEIAQDQIAGISRIAEIANLRAKAGISSQADPVQAQSYLEAARSNLIAQQSQLSIYQEKLRTLLNLDTRATQWKLPDGLLQNSKIFEAAEFSKIPRMMAAQAEIEVAQLQKKQVDLSRYPTFNIKGSLSQAVNGVNPNNHEDNGMYNSIMFEANSNFYQGGATNSRSRAASYAEQAARAQVNAVQLDVLNQIRATRENIENKKRQMDVLISQQSISVRTKELYQEQYKLGTRTVVDLLNAEQSIHSASMQIETNRYDIYSSLVQFIAVSGNARDVYQLNNMTIQGVEIRP